MQINQVVYRDDVKIAGDKIGMILCDAVGWLVIALYNGIICRVKFRSHKSSNIGPQKRRQSRRLNEHSKGWGLSCFTLFPCFVGFFLTSNK